MCLQTVAQKLGAAESRVVGLENEVSVHVLTERKSDCSAMRIFVVWELSEVCLINDKKKKKIMQSKCDAIKQNEFEVEKYDFCFFGIFY